MNALIFLLVALVIYLLWLPSIGWGLKRLRCVRSFGKPAVFEGEEGEMIETVRNDSPFLIPWLRLESRVSPHLRLGSQENLDVSAHRHYSSVFTLMPYQQIRRTHKVTFLRRGQYDLGNASLTVGDLLGFSQRHLQQELSASVTVYPRLLDETHLPSLNSLLMGSPSNHRQLTCDPFLIRGIRPYLPGDPVRDIHWPATARTGQAQVRIHDHTTRTQLLVVINAQCEDLQWFDRVPEALEPDIEYGIALAATLCVRALQDGLAAGFASNMPRKGTGDASIMLPGEGTARIDELLTALAQLDTVCAQNFVAFLDSLQTVSGLDILVLSRYDSESIQQCLTKLRGCGNRVAFHLLKGDGI